MDFHGVDNSGINDIQFMTEKYPPYQFEVDGKLKGI